ncbi:putative divalent metal transporter [Besnoitia besnoiti]|uniref:Putative divalent metal transporter n=1 Tax=Besnoitia besnoiti TaxID=94643 RepID=A0A2A9MMM4_BESBE|nr:putative divalent metal transporter [Besnoitia besnoiti]PFH36840.1 putative divalent metal transporter [Besnoitia besnoiti]
MEAQSAGDARAVSGETPADLASSPSVCDFFDEVIDVPDDEEDDASRRDAACRLTPPGAWTPLPQLLPASPCAACAAAGVSTPKGAAGAQWAGARGAERARVPPALRRLQSREEEGATPSPGCSCSPWLPPLRTLSPATVSASIAERSGGFSCEKHYVPPAASAPSPSGACPQVASRAAAVFPAASSRFPASSAAAASRGGSLRGDSAGAWPVAPGGPEHREETAERRRMAAASPERPETQPRASEKQTSASLSIVLMPSADGWALASRHPSRPASSRNSSVCSEGGDFGGTDAHGPTPSRVAFFVSYALPFSAAPVSFLSPTGLLAALLRLLHCPFASAAPATAASPVAPLLAPAPPTASGSTGGRSGRSRSVARDLATALLLPPVALLALPVNAALLALQLVFRGVEALLPPPLPARFQWKKFAAFLGPGWLVAMAFLDPGNLEGDLQAGSRREAPGVLPPGAPDPRAYALLWVLLWAHVGGWVFQVLAARLGNATGKDLATLCRSQYNRSISVILWLLTEIAIIGADIQAVIGSAVAFNLLLGFPIWLAALVTLADSFTFLSLNAQHSQRLERFFSFFIGVMAIAFIYTLALSQPSLRLILHGLFVPTVPESRADAFDLLALIGCIIMPHNIFLHSALVLTRNVKRGRQEKVAEANYYFSLEAALALAVSFFLNGCVLCTFANPMVKTPEGEQLTLATAPAALQSAFGNGALFIWATGLLSAGQNAAMVGTYAGQFVMQGFLNLHFSRTVRLLLTRLVTILPVAALASLDQAVVDSICRLVNIAQAFLLPFALVPLLLFSTSHKVMGRFVLAGWRCAAVLTLALGVTAGNFAAAFYQLSALDLTLRAWLAFAGLLLVYAALLLLIARQKIRSTACAYLLAAERERRARGGGIAPRERRSGAVAVPGRSGLQPDSPVVCEGDTDVGASSIAGDTSVILASSDQEEDRAAAEGAKTPLEKGQAAREAGNAIEV